MTGENQRTVGRHHVDDLAQVVTEDPDRGVPDFAHARLAVAALVVEHHPDVPAGLEVGKNLVPARVVQAPPMSKHDGRRPASDRTIGQDLLGHDVGAVGDGDTVDPQ